MLRGGLEVRGADGRWHAVPAEDGAYVVNIGDALERWTAGAGDQPSTVCQIPPTQVGQTRGNRLRSFHNANWDAVIDVLEPCRPIGGNIAEPITAGQHLMERFLSTQQGE